MSEHSAWWIILHYHLHHCHPSDNKLLESNLKIENILKFTAKESLETVPGSALAISVALSSKVMQVNPVNIKLRKHG